LSVEETAQEEGLARMYLCLLVWIRLLECDAEIDCGRKLERGQSQSLLWG
jgi:hypothetical protein